jgi:biopolymer transport protein ExbB/TolQ
MDVLDQLYLGDILHTISSDLLIPTVVILFALVLYSLYSIGSIVIEIVTERRYYRAVIPELVAKLSEISPQELGDVIESSGLLRRQKDDLAELATYMYLPEDALTEVAKRLLASENLSLQKVVFRAELVTKIAPMLGLMGTLIPLGPGIVALGNGDTAALSASLLVAFDTTVAGLATAAVCFFVSQMRRRWYFDYLVNMEAVFNTMLERAAVLHDEGYEFDRTVFTYGKSGRTARRESLEPGAKALPGAKPEPTTGPVLAAKAEPGAAAAAKAEPGAAAAAAAAKPSASEAAGIAKVPGSEA